MTRSLALLLACLLSALMLLMPAPAAIIHAQDPAAGGNGTTFWDGQKSKADVDKAVDDYFNASWGERRRLRDMMDTLGFANASTMQAYTQMLMQKITQGDKIDAASGQYSDGNLTGKIFLGGNTSGSKRPLLLSLHGGGRGVGDGKGSLNQWSQFASSGIVIAPTAPELRDIAWNFADIEAWVLHLMEAAKRTWDIDTNRIYVAGHSMGGYGTWCMGGRHADRFAALAPSAAGGRDPQSREHLPNLLNTPIWFYHSDDDPVIPPATDREAAQILKDLVSKGYPYEYIYDEQKGRGHGLPAGGSAKQIAWMLEHTRKAYPKWVIWEPSREDKKLFNWIGATDTYSNNEYDIVDRKMQIGRTGRIEAKIDGQTITVKSEGDIGKITIYLCDKLLNVQAPVTIIHNDEVVFRGPVYPRVSALVHSLALHRDPEQYYTHAVYLDDPYKGTVAPVDIPDADIKLKLLNDAGAFEVSAKPFVEVTQIIAGKLGVPVYIDPRAAKQLEKMHPVTMKEPPLSWDSILKILCKQKGVDFEVKGSAVWIMPGSGVEEKVAEPEPEELYLKGTKEFDIFMDMAAQVVPKGHRVFRSATSVSNAISQLSEQYQAKVRELLDYGSRRVRGEEKEMYKALRDLIPE